MNTLARIRIAAGGALLGLALATAPQAIHAAPVRLSPSVSLYGTWYNSSAATREITHLSVSFGATGTLVHSYGACHPSDCDWGNAALSRISPANPVGVAHYHFSFAEVTQTLYLTGPFLRVGTATHFTDNSGRSDYSTLEYFVSPAASGRWVNYGSGTQSIAELSLQFSASPQLTAGVYGACHPTNCPWGTQQVTAAVPLYLYYDQGFAKKEVVIAGAGPNLLQVQTFVRFSDPSRQNYHTIETLTYAG